MLIGLVFVAILILGMLLGHAFTSIGVNGFPGEPGPPGSTGPTGPRGLTGMRGRSFNDPEE